MQAILVFFHCGANTGYAIAPLERAFLRMARNLVHDDRRIHFAYVNLDKGFPNTLPPDFVNVIAFDPLDGSPAALARIGDYIRAHGIDVAFGFDQAVAQPSYATLRRAGIRALISYWGAPMSAANSGAKLWLKRLEVALRRHKPDHYIFESQAMARSATHGRGIAARDVSVVYLGVDAERYRPAPSPSDYAYTAFNIPRERRIVFFSGHMEERKGVHILVRAAVELVARTGRRDVHFLILGNQPGEDARFAPLYRDTAAADAVTFGGYRDDIPAILPSCYCGAIASTGWDSFTMSSLEMAASGLPLVVSRLQGLVETVDDARTGFLFTPGDPRDLAAKLTVLLDDPARRAVMGAAARERILQRFTIERQVAALTEAVARAAT